MIFIKLLYGSCRWQVTGFSNVQQLLDNNKSFIIAFWHGNLLIPYYKVAKYRFHVLAGFHKDAELGVIIGKKLGWRFLRGSSSQNGSEVFEEMVGLLSKPGNVLAITPDGPKGPAKMPKPGAIRAAQKTGVPIIPVAGYSRRNWGFANWDTFYVTKPFTRIELKFGDPLYFSINDDFKDSINRLKKYLDTLESDAIISVKK